MEQLWKINMFNFSKRSLRNLDKVHPLLVGVVVRALSISEVDITVTEGIRNIERQRKLVAEGASKTMNSLHLPQADGFSHAVDLAAYVGGISWEWVYYYMLADAMKQAAKELNVEIEWGGDWKTFKDGPHFQLSKKYRN